MLIAFIASFCAAAFAQQTPASAKDIMEKAFSKAKAENKNVFIIFHASWCGWCKKMDAAINDTVCKAFFRKNYVVEYLTILESKEKRPLENSGAEELFKKYAPENSGIPFWLVFDGKTKSLIGGATMPDGSNSGCPASPEEVAHLLEILSRSSKMDSATAKAVYDRFRKSEIPR